MSITFQKWGKCLTSGDHTCQINDMEWRLIFPRLKELIPSWEAIMITGKANYDSIRLHHSICKDLKIDIPMRDVYWRKKPWLGPWTVSRDQRQREGGKEDITEYIEITGAVRILDQQIGQMDALKSYQT